MLLCRQREKRMLPIVQQTEVSACIVDSPRGIQNDFNRRSRVKRRCAEFLISIMGWDRRRKRKYPAVSDKIVTGQRNLIIDPREQGKFLFWRGVNYRYVSENVIKKESSPLLLEGGFCKEFQTRWK